MLTSINIENNQGLQGFKIKKPAQPLVQFPLKNNPSLRTRTFHKLAQSFEQPAREIFSLDRVMEQNRSKIFKKRRDRADKKLPIIR